MPLLSLLTPALCANNTDTGIDRLPLDSTTKAHWLMLLTIVLAASSFPVGAAITNELSPSVMMFIRFSLAAILFSPYVFIKNDFQTPSKKKVFYYTILSIPLVVFFWCMFESLRYTSVLNTGALYTLVPVITAVFTLLINREVTTKFRSIGLIIGTLGALWIVFRGDYVAFLGLKLNYGDFIFIVGCIFLGLYNPLVKKFHSGEPMEIMTFWVLLFGACWLLIISSTSILDVDWYTIEISVYAGVLYLALFTTLVTFYLLQLCVVKIGPTKVAAYGFLTPVFVIVISAAIGMEELELVTLPGILMVIMAMFIIQKEPKVSRSKST